MRKLRRISGGRGDAARGSRWAVRGAGEDAVPRGAADELAVASPIASISLILAGLGLALVLLPAEIEGVGMLKTSALALAAGVLAGPAWAARADPKALFRAEHLLSVGLVFWLLLDLIQGLYRLEGVSRTQVVWAMVAVAVFPVAMWLGAMGRFAGMVDWLRRRSGAELSSHAYFRIGLLTFALAFCRFGIPSGFDLGLMVESLGGNRWSAPWVRNDLGGWDAVLDHLSYFGYLLPILTVVVGRRFGWVSERTVVLFLASLVIGALMAQGGGRRIIGVFVISGVAFWFLTAFSIGLRQLLILGIWVVATIGILETVLDYRGVGYRALLEAESEEQLIANEEAGIRVRVDDNFLRLSQIVGIFPEGHSYVPGSYIGYMMVRPIPRALWPGKPSDPGFDLATFLGLKGVSLSSTVVGELFTAGGFLGVMLGGFLYGRLASSLGAFLGTSTVPGVVLVYSVGVMALFTGLRSAIDLILLSYVILAWLGVCWLVRRLTPRARGG